MIYSPIKKGCINIPKIGIGGNIFGHFADQNLTRNILDCADEFGLNLIDTSDSYSSGLSEEFVGRAISGNRGNWLIASKCGLKSGEIANDLGSSKSILKKLNGSLTRLNTDYLDIYQMHHFDQVTPLEETITTLEDCVQAGKIRYYGISNYSLAQTKLFYEQVNSLNSLHFLSSQAPFNIFRNEAKDHYLPWCKEHGIAFFCYGVLARGLLSDKYIQQKSFVMNEDSRALVSESIRSDLRPSVIAALNTLNEFALDMGLSLSQMALKYAVTFQGVSAAIIGVRSVSQLTNLVKGMSWEGISSDVKESLELISGPIRVESLHLGGKLRF